MGTAPESTAQPLTALTTNYSLHPACMHTTQCSRSHDHIAGWAESGGGLWGHLEVMLPTPLTHCRVAATRGEETTSLPRTPRTTPTRVDQYRRTPHSNWYVCMCVLCVWTMHWCQSRCYNSQGCGSLGLIQIHHIPCQSVTPGSFTPCGALWVGHFLGGAT